MAGIRQAVLNLAGYSTNTGGAEEAARLLAEFGWAESTWSTRASQIATWMRFCDEDMRDALPATEGDVLAYIGFLSLKGTVSGDSLPQYVSAISRFHELHYLPSPTKTPLVRALVRGYKRHYDNTATIALIRIGCPAHEMRKVVVAGLASSDALDLSCCTAVIIAFIFQLRSVSVAHLERHHLTFAPTKMTGTFHVRKGKSVRRPLILDYPYSATWCNVNPIALIRRWYDTHPEPRTRFPLSLGDSLTRALQIANVTAPPQCTYQSHSPRIGGYNELFCLHFSKEWIMRRLDWETEAMLRLYSDSRIVSTADSRWFFAHLLP